VTSEVIFLDKQVLPFFYRILNGQREQIPLFESNLERVSKNLKGPFFMGNQFTMVDLIWAPFYQRLITVGKFYMDFDLNNAKLHKWGQACLEHKAVACTIVDVDRLLENYNGYANGTAKNNASSLYGFKK
jgi:glutathione S-transferase